MEAFDSSSLDLNGVVETRGACIPAIVYVAGLVI
jgi:hypothetical protein